MGVLSDVMIMRSPVHLIGCAVGAVSLSLLTTVQTQSHTALLASYLTSFSIFENGATIVIAIVLCDIGKDQIVLT